MANKSDAKKIFRHYRGMSESQLESEKKNIERHTSEMKKIGIHTTPEHAQSIKYHLSQKKKKMAGKMGRAPSKKEMKKFNSEQPDDYRYKHLHD